MADGRQEPHRFYENEYPEMEELVLARITRIDAIGAYAELPEYGNKEGMLLLSELSKRRFRSVNKLIKIGQVQCVMVIRADQDKGYIDLSKKRVDTTEIPDVEERYSKSKKVDLTLRHVASDLPDVSVDSLYAEVAWPLTRDHGFKHALEGLLVCLEDPEKAFAHVDRTKIPQAALDAIVEDLKLRMTPPNSKMRATFDVTCSGYEGVEAVKAAIHKGFLASNELVKDENTEEFKNDLSVRLIAPPRFICTVSDRNRERGMERIHIVMEEAEKAIKEYDGGDFRVFEEIMICGDEDEVKAGSEEDSESYDDESSEEIEGMGMAAGEEE